MEQNGQIQLIQKPIIAHKLSEIGKNVVARIEELNVASLVATEETIKSMKNLRADLNKELADFENQRKALKEAVAAPYMEFETVYKSEISEKYKAAIDILKDKISIFELRVKKEKQDSIIAYFTELITVEKIDFLKFEQIGLEVNLTTTEKAYRDQVNTFVQRVIDDQLLINSMAFPAEMMTEYKTNGLNASLAITTVNNRKEKERLENERIKMAENDRRIKMLQSLAFVLHDLTKTYNNINDDAIYITIKDIETLNKADFNHRFVELENRVKAQKKDLFTSAPVQAPVQAPIVQPTPKTPIQAPIEEIFNTCFEVAGTMKQLKELAEYMRTNKIEFKTI